MANRNYAADSLAATTRIVTTDTTLDEDHGKTALTALVEEVRNSKTPIIVERLVAKIDEIVRRVRFPGWQSTIRVEVLSSTTAKLARGEQPWHR